MNTLPKIPPKVPLEAPQDPNKDSQLIGEFIKAFILNFKREKLCHFIVVQFFKPFECLLKTYFPGLYYKKLYLDIS